jgi:hypothetical protein
VADDPLLAGDVYAKAFLDQLERARPAPKIPEWERIASEMQLVGRTGRESVGAGSSRPLAHSIAGSMRSWKSGAGCLANEIAMRLQVAAWGFVAPAVLVIGVFFALPVLAGWR